MDEGTGEGGALHLAAGELVGAVVAAIGQADGFKQIAGAGFSDGIGTAGEEEGKKDVFFHGEGRKKVEELENKTDFQLAEAGEGIVVHGVDGKALQVNLTGSGGIEGSKNVQESAFATPAGPRNGHDFPGKDFEGDPAESLHLGIARLIGLMEIACFEHKKAGLRDM